MSSTAPTGHASSQWFRSAVVYQIYPRSFADSDGDGIGDLPGVVGKLDHLQTLGVDVVWLCPIYRSPQDDNGYDVSDYRDVDPIFGTLADLDRLIAGLHARGMKLVMDLVVNHTSDEHPWFAESRSSLHNPKRDWYWWRPPRAGREGGSVGAEPNNWGSAFSGPAWEHDPATGEYYLHLFSPKQPELNWENAEVRSAVHEMMNWWLDRGVDGFRMDVVNYLSKDVALPDGPAVPGKKYADGSPHYVSGPRIHEFLQEMHHNVFAERTKDLLVIGEMPGVSAADAILFTDPARAEVDMVYQFEHLGVDLEDGNKWRPRPLELVQLKAALGRWQEALADRGWNSLFWGSHDAARAVSRFGDDGTYRVQSAKMLAGILHLHRGTPFIYQGEELGMTNMRFADFAEHRDIEVLNHRREATMHGGCTEAEVLAAVACLNRDNARTPVQWDATQAAGFTIGLPWIGVNPNATEINAASQVNDPDSVLNFYRRLIELRHHDPVVSHGDFTMLMPEHQQIYAFRRELDRDELLVIGNFSAHEQLVDGCDPDWAAAVQILGNYPERATLDLRPWELKVFRRSRTELTEEILDQ